MNVVKRVLLRHCYYRSR